MATYTFLSTKRNLRVSFPEDQFGLSEGGFPFKHSKFEMGFFTTENEKVAERMRKHTGFGDEFIEQKTSTDSIMQKFAQPAATAPEGGISDELKENIQQLDRLSGGHFVAPQKKIAVSAFTKVCKAFSVTGIPLISVDDDIRGIAAAINTLLGLLETNKLITKAIYERKGTA